MNQRAGCHEHPAKFFTKKCYIRSIARSKMTKSQKEINDVMVQVLEEVIFPRFDQLDEKVDYTNRRLDALVDWAGFVVN